MSKGLRKYKPDSQGDLFIVDVADVALKDAQKTMTLPFLSLSKRPRFEPIEFTNDNGQTVIVTGGKPFGIATIWDYDIMLWMFGQLRKMIDDGESSSLRKPLTPALPGRGR